MIINNINDFEKIMDTNQKIILDFYAQWCGPCKMLAPILEKVASQNKDWTICKIDIDKLSDLAAKFAIQAVPTLVFIKDKKVLETAVGFQPDVTIQKIINKIN